MSITNGSAVTKTDLDSMLTMSLVLVATDNAQLPTGFQWHATFPNLVASTPIRCRKAVFVAPCDLLLETVALEAGDHTAASTTQVAVTAGATVDDLASTTDLEADPRNLVFWPHKVSATTGAGTTLCARVMFDGTKTNPKSDFTATSRAARVVLAGSTIVVSVSTTSVATPSKTHVVLVFREFFQRE